MVSEISTINLHNITNLEEAKEVIANCLLIIEELLQEIKSLQSEVAALKKNSSNSSKPPSSDIVKPLVEQRQPGKRKSGGQIKHKGMYRLMLPEDKIDERQEAIISDFHSAYISYANANQQFCLAHLIRDIKYLCTLPFENVKSFGDKLLSYFANLFRLWHKKHEIPIDDFKRKLRRHVVMIENYLFRCEDKSEYVVKMKRRFFKRWKCLFRFTEEPLLYEPTNNLAEQTLRVVTKIRRLTQGTRSVWGQLWWSRILSVIGTCRKKKLSAFRFIVDAVNASKSDANYPVLLQHYTT